MSSKISELYVFLDVIRLEACSIRVPAAQALNRRKLLRLKVFDDRDILFREISDCRHIVGLDRGRHNQLAANSQGGGPGCEEFGGSLQIHATGGNHRNLRQRSL